MSGMRRQKTAATRLAEALKSIKRVFLHPRHEMLSVLARQPEGTNASRAINREETLKISIWRGKISLAGSDFASLKAAPWVARSGNSFAATTHFAALMSAAESRAAFAFETCVHHNANSFLAPLRLNGFRAEFNLLMTTTQIVWWNIFTHVAAMSAVFLGCVCLS